MRTVLVGNRRLAKHVLLHLLDSGWDLVGVVAPEGEAARRQAGYVPLEDVAKAHDLALIRTNDINDESSRSRLRSLSPDRIICPGWHEIVDSATLSIPRHGFVGFHASDLPAGRGGAPVNWSLIHGAERITLSLFKYTPGVDDGDIIHKESLEIGSRDDIDTLLSALACAACDALDASREALESGEVEATPQSLSEATYRPRRQPQDGRIDWSKPADELDDWVRAQTDPYPGAFTFVDGRRLTVWSARPLLGDVSQATPGTVTSVVDGEGLDVATGDGMLRLCRVQADEGPRQWADEWASRHGLDTGTVLGTGHEPDEWCYTGIRDAAGGTDFSDATNLRQGERGRIQAVVESAVHREITVRVTLNSGKLLTETVSVDGGLATVHIAYEPPTSGTHTLRVIFDEGGEEVDSRILKVFVSE